MSFIFDPILPIPVWIILGIGLLLLTIFSSLFSSKELGKGKRLSLLLIRILAVALLWCLALRPSIKEPIDQSNLNRQFAILIDTSASMSQRDVSEGTRLDAAIEIMNRNDVENTLKEKGLTPSVFQFGRDLENVKNEEWRKLKAAGDTTLFHDNIEKLLQSIGGSLKGILVLSDGHDFSSYSATRTANLAKDRRVPIHTWPLGKAGKVRDASIRLAGHPPYVHIEQEAKLQTVIQARGLELESVEVKLHREGTLVQSQTIDIDDRAEIPVNFRVKEDKPGQVEYRISLSNVRGETSKDNNEAYVYLNVVKKEMRILMLEGEPYWDTTFLQRSLMANDKFDVDVITHYAPNRLRRIRKKSKLELNPPKKRQDFKEYDIVIIGRNLDSFMTRHSFDEIKNWVENDGGNLVFCRGIIGEKLPESMKVLHPTEMSDEGIARVSLKSLSEGKHLGILDERLKLEENPEIPKIIAARSAENTKQLVTVLAKAGDSAGESVPALLFRKFGKGQVMAVGLDGLWHWGFHAESDPDDNAFNHFWDQLLVWLVAGGNDLISDSQFLRMQRSNLSLGEEAQVMLKLDKEMNNPKNSQLRVYHQDQLAHERKIQLGKEKGKADHFKFLPEKTGRYRVEVDLPGGDKAVARFIAFNDDRERLEVNMDEQYLKRISKISEGQVLEKDDDLSQVFANLGDTEKIETKYKIQSQWDKIPIYLIIILLLCSEWAFRRRWGLT